MKEEIKAWFRDKKGFDHVALLFSNRRNEQVELDIESLFEECMTDLMKDIQAQAVTELISQLAYTGVLDGTATSIIDVDSAIKYADRLGEG